MLLPAELSSCRKELVDALVHAVRETVKPGVWIRTFFDGLRVNLGLLIACVDMCVWAPLTASQVSRRMA